MSLARVVAVAGALCGCALGVTACGAPLSVSAQIRQWSAGAGYPDLDQALEADFPEVRAGITSGNLKGLKTACAGMSIDAGNIYNTLVTPDHALTNALARALSGLAKVGQQCNDLRSGTAAATAALARELSADQALYDKERAVIVAADRTS